MLSNLPSDLLTLILLSVVPKLSTADPSWVLTLSLVWKKFRCGGVAVAVWGFVTVVLFELLLSAGLLFCQRKCGE